MTKEVGFGSLSNHFLQRSRKDGSDFNLLVVGPAGCGKSTLLSNLYHQDILPADRRRNARIADAVEFIEHESEIVEAGVALRLKVTEVLGYGELSFGKTRQNALKIQKILKHVDEKHKEHFERENYAQSMKKSSAATNRDQLYHAAIVFVQPQRNLNINVTDIDLLKALQGRVNVIPVIGKADTYINEELTRIKANLKKSLHEAKILLFPNITDHTDDDWVIKEAVDVRSHCPFTTIAARPSEAHNGARFRQYPWGLISVDSPLSRTAKLGNAASIANASSQSLSLANTAVARINEHTGNCCGNDLIQIQKMLIRSHFEFLKSHTVEKLYENFRTEIIGRIQTAPEAPMRLNKSTDELKSIEHHQQEQQEQPKQQQQEQEEAEMTDEEELFKAVVLEPIREEREEDSPAQLPGNITNEPLNTKSKKMKKSKSANHLQRKMSAEQLQEAHDELVSPLPGLQ